MPASDPQRVGVGTEFLLTGIKNEDMEKAKDFFLVYSGDESIVKTTCGAVLQHKLKGPKRKARIYVSGLFVAEEENFLFSYNITSQLRKVLNRGSIDRLAYYNTLVGEFISFGYRSYDEISILLVDLGLPEYQAVNSRGST